MRFEKEVSIYAPESVLKRFQAAETSIEVTQGKIGALISESELVELTNSKATMYSKLASAVLEIDALQLNFSDLTTKYNTVTGQYSALDSKVAQYKLGVDGLSADIATVRKDIQDKYSTTTQMQAAINASVSELSLSVSSTYAKQTDVTALETWKKEASVKITDSAIVSAVTSSSAWGQKTDAAQVDSLIEQKADSIRLKAATLTWIATNSSMTEDGTFSCRNAIISGDISTEKTISNWKFNSNIGTINTWYYGRGISRGGFSVKTAYSTNCGEITISPAPYELVNSYTDRAYNIINSNRALLIEARVGEASTTQWAGIKILNGDVELLSGYNNTSFTALSISLGSDNQTITGTLNGQWQLPTHLMGYVYDTTTNAANVWMGNSKSSKVSRVSSSSRRYKHDITDVDEALNPEALYNLPVRSFTYNAGYLSDGDRNAGKRMVGFIAEEVEAVYPKACQYNENGQVEMWNSQILLPAMLQLIQEQHKEIENLKKRMEGV